MNSDVDFAVAAWHESGTWNLEMLPDPYNLGSIIKELQNHQTNGGALALIAIDEEFDLAYISTADVYGEMEDYNSALKFYHDAIKISKPDRP